MKLLIFTFEFPPFAGGAGTYSRDLAVGLARTGNEVHVLAARTDGDTTLPDLSGVANLQVHWLDSWRRDAPYTLAPLLKLHLRHRFDYVLVTERRAHEAVATLPGTFFPYAAVLFGSELLDWFSEPPRSGDQLRMTRYCEGADLCIAISRATLELARRSVRDRPVNLAEITCGIDTGRLPVAIPGDVARLRERYGTDAELVFCLGRLDIDKGQDTLISAFQHVRRIRPRAQLLIGGTGPLKQQLLELRASLQLDDSVHFVGKIPEHEITTYFAACDVFALPSRSQTRWEGFGLVYLEAAAYEKPTVGGTEGGVPEAIADGRTGILVDPRDPDAIGAALITLLANADLRGQMGRAGRERVFESFTAERMALDTVRHLETSTRRRSLATRVRQMINCAGWLAWYRYQGIRR